MKDSGHLHVAPLRELTLRHATHTAGQRHLSAASGLVCTHGRAYVMGDDEHHLAIFKGPHQPGRTVQLFSGDLPSGMKARKKLKPDMEALVLLPLRMSRPEASLLALGSGSRPNRCRAAWVRLDQNGKPHDVRRKDLVPVYEPLMRRFSDLNIEGAFVHGDALVLLQRGHAGGSANASIRFRVADWLAWLQDQGDPPRAIGIRQHKLGIIDGTPLGFTDGAALPNGQWIFSAVAEATDNSVADGACVGSAVGVMAQDGTLLALHTLPSKAKIEGIAAQMRDRMIDLCLVTDADDPRIPSQLLRGRIRQPGG